MGNLKHTGTIIILILFLSLLIVFDAFQQKYYIDQFQLSASRPIATFLKAHFTRWVIWLIGNIPFILVIWRYFASQKDQTTINYKRLVAVGGFSFGLSLALVTIESIISQDVLLTWTSFAEVLTFFFYQKGITFMMAQVGLVLFIYNLRLTDKVNAQWVEIESLQAHNNNPKTPQIRVKSGGLTKLLDLKDICWIQADDYCVKVHTESQSFYLRKSLKFLEEQLSAHDFIRVHRGALLNMSYVSDVSFPKAKVILKDQSEVPISKSGEQQLKRVWLDQAV